MVCCLFQGDRAEAGGEPGVAAVQGAAKSVVRHLDWSDFDKPEGLNRLLDVLREFSLQRLPIPDSFQRLERWSNMRRGANETVPQLLVREEELFTELQQALHRARQERYQVVSVGMVTSAPRSSQRGPSMSPSQSPTAGLAGAAARSDPASPSKASGGDEDERSSVEDSQS